MSEQTVFTDFVTADLTETGAAIRQITGSKVAAEIHLDPAQVRFVLDQLSPSIQAKALQDAADALELPGTSATGYYSSGDHAGYQEAEGHAETWLRARAAAVRGESK